MWAAYTVFWAIPSQYLQGEAAAGGIALINSIGLLGGFLSPSIIGWIKTVEWLQWYEVSSEPGGELDSEGHQRGSIESLSVTAGEFEVEVGDIVQRAKAGETLRYRCDRRHIVRCVGTEPGSALMVCILKAAVME